mgnify:FL=1
MKIAVGVLYRPPSKPTNCIDNLEITLANLTAEMDEIILMGDLNIDFLVPSSPLQNLNNVLDTFNLKQVINTPTRITKHSATLLDIICLKSPREILDHGTVDLLHVTDHLLTFCEINLQPPKDKINKVTYTSFKYFDSNEFSRDASLINWNHIINLESTDEKLFFLTKQ